MMITRFLRTVGIFSLARKELQFASIPKPIRTFATSNKSQIPNLGESLSAVREQLGIKLNMTIEEKYDALIKAQKEGKIPANKIILSPCESTLGECRAVCAGEVPEWLTVDSNWLDVYVQGQKSLNIIQKALGGEFSQHCKTLLQWVKELAYTSNEAITLANIKNCEIRSRFGEGPVMLTVGLWRHELLQLKEQFLQDSRVSHLPRAIDSFTIITAKLPAAVWNVSPAVESKKNEIQEFILADLKMIREDCPDEAAAIKEVCDLVISELDAPYSTCFSSLVASRMAAFNHKNFEHILSNKIFLLVSEAERQLKRSIPRLDRLSSESSWAELFIIGSYSLDLINKKLGGVFAEHSSKIIDWVKQIDSLNDVSQAINNMKQRECSFHSGEGNLDNLYENWLGGLHDLRVSGEFSRLDDQTKLAVNNLMIIANKLVSEILDYEDEYKTRCGPQ